jgi:hypothetical protein
VTIECRSQHEHRPLSDSWIEGGGACAALHVNAAKCDLDICRDVLAAQGFYDSQRTTQIDVKHIGNDDLFTRQEPTRDIDSISRYRNVWLLLASSQHRRRGNR